MQREILAAELKRTEDGEELWFTVDGRSFLRYMVRKMVGTLLEVGKGRVGIRDIPRLLEKRDRSLSGPTAPPHGLYLVSLEYPDPADSLALSRHSKRPVASE